MKSLPRTRWDLAGLLVFAFFANLSRIDAQEPTAEETAKTKAAQLILVVGAPGQPEYGEAFRTWATKWKTIADTLHAKTVSIGLDSETTSTDSNNKDDHAALLESIHMARIESTEPVWLVMIGHGTFSRNEAKFNLRGPDISLQELKLALQDFPRPIVIVNCASSSGPFIQPLSGKDRVIITATRSGTEENYARFGEYFAEAISDTLADLDHDDQVSLLEAFLSASKRVEQFYESEGRLATEHAMLDDNGDGLGTPASFFQGIRAVRTAKNKAQVDGRYARRWSLTPEPENAVISDEARTTRTLLENELDALRDRKSSMDESRYYEELEQIMLKLAKLSTP